MPKALEASGAVVKRDSTAALADAIERMNRFAQSGVDEDFQRSADEHDVFYGDLYQPKTPNLATLRRAPYCATPVYSGEIGASGGLILDEHARVMVNDGEYFVGCTQPEIRRNPLSDTRVRLAGRPLAQQSPSVTERLLTSRGKNT